MKGREECRGGPQGAESGTLTSARKWSVKLTSRLPGDSLVFFLIFEKSFLSFLKHVTKLNCLSYLSTCVSMFLNDCIIGRKLKFTVKEVVSKKGKQLFLLCTAPDCCCELYSI